MPRFAFHVLRGIEANITGDAGAAFASINRSAIASIEIPLPPPQEQSEILSEIERYEAVIAGAQSVVGNYRPQIPLDSSWPTVELREIIESKPKNGYSGKPVTHVTGLKVLSLSATTSGTLDLSKFKYLDEDIPPDAPCRCRKGDIYLQRGNTAELVGTAALFDVDGEDFIFPDLMIRVRADESVVLSDYLLLALQSPPVRSYLKRSAVGAAGSMPKINQGVVESIPIRLPPIAAQQVFVDEIAVERRLIDANRQLIARFRRKVKAALLRVWGEEGEAT